MPLSIHQSASSTVATITTHQRVANGFSLSKNQIPYWMPTSHQSTGVGNDHKVTNPPPPPTVRLFCRWMRNTSSCIQAPVIDATANRDKTIHFTAMMCLLISTPLSCQRPAPGRCTPSAHQTHAGDLIYSSGRAQEVVTCKKSLHEANRIVVGGGGRIVGFLQICSGKVFRNVSIALRLQLINTVCWSSAAGSPWVI